STLITRAPSPASSSVAYGPARAVARSITVRPARGRAVGRAGSATQHHLAVLPGELGVQAGPPGDVGHVPGDPASLLVVAERHGPARVVDPAGHEPGRDQLGPVEAAGRDHGVAALRVEGVE